jgi:hypothetical protein
MHPADKSAFVSRNSSRDDDFCGLSLTEMRGLLCFPFGEGSPLSIRRDIDDSTLDRIPFFRLVEETLRIIDRDGFIPLTEYGDLPSEALVELHSHKFIVDPYLDNATASLCQEENSKIFLTLHCVLAHINLVSNRNGGLVLTAVGQQLIRNKLRLQLFEILLAAYTLRFHWAWNDRCPPFPVGQLGWGYSLYLLAKFGDRQRTIQFFADKYQKAFPTMLDILGLQPYDRPEYFFVTSYSARCFRRFFEWFGFVALEKPDPIVEPETQVVTTTDLVNKVFSFD